MRVRIRERWYPLADVCVYHPDFGDERYPSTPPLLWIEILSQDDHMVDVWNKANELVANGVPSVWIINPETLEGELRTAAGLLPVPDYTLQLPDSGIVIPLRDVVEE